MNLLCPNCQKMLSVEDQFAGQLMKCPLCNNTFTVPGLPQSPAVPPAATRPETYSMTPEPAKSQARKEEPATPRGAAEPPRQSSAAQETVPTGHQWTGHLTLRPELVPWVAPASLLVVFILLFFAWVGYYPSGYGVLTQNAWEAFWGTYTRDPVWEKYFSKSYFNDDAFSPGGSFLLALVVLLLLATIALAIAAAVLPMVRAPLPPFVQQIRPWRWAIVSGLGLVTLILLVLQFLVGFPLENATKTHVEKIMKELHNKPIITPEDQREYDLRVAIRLAELSPSRTSAFRAAVLFLILAIIGAGLAYWLERRGSRPLPRMDLMC